MQNESPPPGRLPSNGAPTRPSTNNDTRLLSHSLKRLSLATASNTPLPQSPGMNSPRSRPDLHRIPSSPGLANGSPASALRRSSSVVSLSRAASPALNRTSSRSSMRGDTPGTPRAASRASLSRRSSFNPNMPSPVVAKSPLGMHAEEKPPLRACDVAEDHFRRELALHEGMAGAANAGTLVIIHDQCYGHRYARPKTSKATLNTIMERPERMLASVRGIATAYVRLGGRHCEGSNPPVPNQTLPERIPFQIRKTSRAVDLTSQAVTNVHGTKWMDEFQKLCESAEGKLATTGKELARDPPTAPGQPPKRQFHPMDLYLCSESLNAIQGALGGVMDAVDAVFQGSSIDNGVSRAFVCIRPPGHHCSAEWPSGFCWINNVHVGIEHAMMNYGLTHAAIVDFDLHHGDGSQSITWGRNKKVQAMHKNTPNWKKTSVGYFSLHDINSFPCEDGDDDKVQAASLCIDNAHGQSVWNIHLETWSTPDEFWTIYEEKYLVLLEKTRKYLKFHTNRLRKSPNHPTPKAAIFLSAGFDASEWETAGMQRHRVNVPTEFYARFTRDVVKLAEEADTGVDGRIISVLEGGYSDRALSSGVLSHLSGLCDGQVWSDSTPSGGLAFDMQRRMKALSVRDEDDLMNGLVAPVTYDPRWWDEARLAELENLVAPPLVVAPKKMRTGPPAHFSSPTQSFTAKVVDPAKLHRTVSGRYPSVSPSRAPTPPPPDVDWATASHALSKLLIPSDRQTQSCRPEELTEPRIKKEKPAPTLASVHVDPSGRQLRGRRPVATYTDAGSDDETPSVRPESRTSRRRTIADLPLPTTEPPEATRSVSRRMSIASTSSSVAGDRSTSRASSVVPGRRSVAPAASTNGVQVKKARGTTTAASRIPKNQPPPVPRVPSNYLSKTASSKEKEPQKEKENDIDQLTSGLKRITLKLPSKEEHDAREKAREAERKAKTTRKPAMPKTAKVTATKPAATKRAAGRPAKMTKPPVPLEPAAPVQALKEPNLEAAAAAPLEQPQPVVPVEAPAVPEQAAVAPPIGPAASTAEVATGPPRRQSGLSLVAEPPTDLIEMSLTPDQLPKPSFVNIVRVESPVMKTTPPRPDTPPPPPPSTIPQFVPQNPHTFGVASPPSQMFAQSASPWGAVNSHPAPPSTIAMAPKAVPPPAPVSAMGAPRPVSAAGKRADLPVFTANGVIPFAPAPNVAVPNGQPNMVAGSDATRVKEEESRKDIWEVPETPAR